MDHPAYAPKLAAVAALIFASFLTLAAQTDGVYRLPAGTHISLRMDAEINSKAASRDDTFLALVAKPVSVSDELVLPVGTRVEGRVTGVRHAAAGGTNGKLELSFERLTFGEREHPIRGTLVRPITPPSGAKFSLLSVFGGAAAGTAIGAASGSTLIGTGLGAAVGAAVALTRKGHEVSIKPDQVFEIELKQDVILPASVY